MNNILRRNLIIGGVVSSVFGLSGCMGDSDDDKLEPTDVNAFCDNKCDIINRVDINSSRNIWDSKLNYTQVIIKFEESISNINLSVEVYQGEEIIDIIDAQESDTSAVKVRFEEYRTDKLEDINIIIHNLDLD